MVEARGAAVLVEGAAAVAVLEVLAEDHLEAVGPAEAGEMRAAKRSID